MGRKEKDYGDFRPILQRRFADVRAKETREIMGDPTKNESMRTVPTDSMRTVPTDSHILLVETYNKKGD